MSDQYNAADAMEQGASWKPLDLGPYLTGDYQPPQPTVGRRDDGVRLFYPGRISSIYSEPEAGKTWFAMLVSANEMRAGNDVVYLDFEDSAEGIVSRLLAMGLPAEMIRKQFTYIQPQEKPGLVGMAHLGDAITPRTSVVWVDGVTEAMSLYGFDPKNDIEVAAFWRQLFRPIAAAGPAIIALDHVIKARDGRGRWATGSQHKLSGLNGCAYVLENVTPFGVGIKGRTRVYVAKDRPGQVRRHCVKTSHDPAYWLGDMVIDSQEGGALTYLYPPRQEGPGGAADVPDAQLPTEMMERVSRFLEGVGEVPSKNVIETSVPGAVVTKRAAVDLLVAGGFFERVPGPRNAAIFRSVKPYREPTESTSSS